MIKRFILITLLIVVAYAALLQWKFWRRIEFQNQPVKSADEGRDENAQKVYSFSFSKYGTEGDKELEIEGDSADILSENVALINVIAKAYAEETPVTITANQGSFDRQTNNVTLKENVVATTETGARLMTDQLDIYPGEKRLNTEDVATVKRDNISIKGTGAESDSQLQKVSFKKNVTVVVQDPNSETKTPTVITSDGPLNIDYKRNVAHFSKNVQAVDQRGTLLADYIDVYYNRDTKRVHKMVARGNVNIVTKEGNKTFSDTAVYLAEEGRIILGGDVDARYLAEEEFEDNDSASKSFF